MHGFLRKDKSLSPDRTSDQLLPPRKIDPGRGKTLFFASHTGSLTIEAALVLPVFLCVMLNVAWYMNAYDDAVRLSSAMAQTAQEMALASYAVDEADVSSTLSSISPHLTGALSVGYASARVRKRAGDMSAVKNLNFLRSKIGGENQMISLVATWQVKTPLGYLDFPFRFYVQKASAREWTGYGSGTTGGEENAETEEEDSQIVYVTATGQVYHTDENCTHLKLSVKEVSYDSLEGRRNAGGAKYHACEICGGSVTGGTVLITNEGNRYHTDRNCRGLKRTVREVKMDDIGQLRPCSRCSGG